MVARPRRTSAIATTTSRDSRATNHHRGAASYLNQRTFGSLAPSDIVKDCLALFISHSGPSLVSSIRQISRAGRASLAPTSMWARPWGGRRFEPVHLTRVILRIEAPRSSPTRAPRNMIGVDPRADLCQNSRRVEADLWNGSGRHLAAAKKLGVVDLSRTRSRSWARSGQMQRCHAPTDSPSLDAD